MCDTSLIDTRGIIRPKNNGIRACIIIVDVYIAMAQDIITLEFCSETKITSTLEVVISVSGYLTCLLSYILLDMRHLKVF